MSDSRRPENSRPLVVISYDSGLPGGVTSEWVDDKLRVLSSWGKPVILVTGPRSQLVDTPNLIVKRAHSISWRDLSSELSGKSIGLTRLPMHFLSSIFGRLFDVSFSRLAGSHSHGKWSWVLSSFPVALTSALRTKAEIIFSTGGPSAAHFVALLVKFTVPRIKLYVEFQDPFIGSEMQLSDSALRVMTWMEKLLISRAEKVVYVTREAAKRTKLRHLGSNNIDSISAIYPGSWNFSSPKEPSPRRMGEQTTFLHLGTLYAGRNLDLFFEALDQLRCSGGPSADLVKIVNQGELAVENPEMYRLRDDFTERLITDRQTALQVAALADFLLLVQHTDSRSEETIPYKTYDYLNLGVPIFALTNNLELNELVTQSGGFVASSKSVLEIKNALIAALKFKESDSKPKTSRVEFDISKQFKSIFS